MPDHIQELINLTIKTLSVPFYKDWAFWAVVVSVFSSIVALIIAFKDQILRQWNKPDLVAEKIEVFQQINSNNSAYWIFRLLIKNEGKSSANNVEIDTSKLFEGGKIRHNFLPAPLRWTHGELFLNRVARNIGSSQSVYLDIATFCPPNYQTDVKYMTPCSLWLATLAGAEIQSFSNINLANTELELKIFAENLAPSTIALNVDYDDKNCTLPKITIKK